ncbi:hypothetical protein AGMMS49975_26880 [Clostridia bacterium]|nr:hypothetical protein AGMMS49975_26880 [Clostridia bacterium]
MERETGTLTAKKLLAAYHAMEINFNLEIQRKSEQWDGKRKSLFILSILQDYPIPALQILKDGKIKYIVDGKQRLTTLFDFMCGEFKLTPKLMESEEDIRVFRDGASDTYDSSSILNKEFDTLPPELQDRIETYVFNTNTYDRAKTSNDDIENVYRRINNGVPLGSDQKLKVILGFDCIKEMHNLIESEFLQKAVNISKGGHTRDAEMSVLVQSIILLNDEPFSGSFLNK